MDSLLSAVLKRERAAWARTDKSNKRVASLADALSAVEDRAGGVEFDGDGYGRPEGKGDEDDEEGDNEVEGTFEHG